MSRYPEGTETRIQEMLNGRGLEWGDIVTITEAGSTAHGIRVPYGLAGVSERQWKCPERWTPSAANRMICCER